MKIIRQQLKLTLGIMALLYTIFHAQQIVSAANDGVELCAKVIIPSLFPFIFISQIVISGFHIKPLRWLSPLEKFCGIPTGSAPLLLLGLLGGYPVGAQSVWQAYQDGALQKDDAQRMLSLFNNAGPSFIFGMIGAILKDVRLCWILLGIQIVSAIITGCLLPNKSANSLAILSTKSPTLSGYLEHSVRTMGKICGWVILFRCFISALDAHIFPYLNLESSALLAGLLELSNGCVRISALENQTLQFVLCSIVLSFGGLCVLLQTKSVVGSLSMKKYFPGKLLQSIISALLAIIISKITVAFW